MVTIIAATDLNGVIGIDNRLPWNSPADLKRFKEITLGQVVIMGRNTYNSIGRPLPDRCNIVITKNPDLNKTSLSQPWQCSNIEEAIMSVNMLYRNKEIFIIGGASIYAYCLKNNLVDKMDISIIPIQCDRLSCGNVVYFPEVNFDKWVLDDIAINPYDGTIKILQYVYRDKTVEVK